MSAIIWNPHEFHVLDRLLTGPKINGPYYTTKILQMLHQAFFLHGEIRMEGDELCTSTTPRLTGW
jgi:hypothetical protein